MWYSDSTLQLQGSHVCIVEVEIDELMNTKAQPSYPIVKDDNTMGDGRKYDVCAKKIGA